jgi:L-ascorbate metabolism protein UlaG (beta-lactamase superfamily)
MQINFIGHATFELVEGDTRVLIDPFLSPNNPAATVSADDVEPTHILITHGHQDHLADAVALAKRTGAPCVALTELAGWLGEQGVEDASDPNLGGTVDFDWGSVKLVPAWHTSTTPDGTVIGNAAGLIVKLGGRTIYHLGDTCLFGDLKLIGERHSIDVALVPIGGHYTMDREDAAYACDLIGASTVIPCHYNTFPAIQTDAEAFKADVEQKTSSHVVVLAPGESHEL